MQMLSSFSHDHLDPDCLIKSCLDVLHGVADLGAGGVIQHKLIGNQFGKAPLHCTPSHWDALCRRRLYGSLQEVQSFQQWPVNHTLHHRQG